VPWYHRLIPLVDYTPLKYFTYFREDEPFGLKDESLRGKIAARYRKASLHDSSDAAQFGYAHFPVRLFCEMRHLIKMCKRALPRVACPVLVVQAEQDDVTGPRNAQFIMEHVDSARRELLLLKQSYHLVSADLERSTVADHLQKFCGSLALSRTESPKAERAHAKIAA
jgi:carboxylesterase